MVKNNPLLRWGAIVVVGYILITQGGLGDIFSSSDGPDELYPADLKTSITLNGEDSLATTATDADVTYYLFTQSGEFLKTATLSSGTASFTVPTGGNYKLIAWLDGGGTEWLPVEKSFSTDGADPTKRAVQTVNMAFVKSSAMTITKLRDPVDLNTDVTCTADAVCNFDVLLTTSTARAAVGKPVITIEVNKSAIADVDMVGLSEITCPTRLSPRAGNVHYCFQLARDQEASEGVVMYSGFLTAASSAPVNASVASFDVLDTTAFVNAGFKTQGISAIEYLLENPLTFADIGAADAGESNLTLRTN